MGCSASRSYDFVPRDQQQNQSPNMSSSSSSSYPQSPVSRALSLPTPLVHHPAVCKGDTDHLVSLISTTYGSLVLIDNPKPNNADDLDFGNSAAKVMKVQDLGDSGDPLSPDSVINTWELMEGLDEVEFVDLNQSLVECSQKEKPFLFGKSKTLDNCYLNKDCDDNELVKTYEIVEHSDSKPLWQHLSEECLIGKFDTNVVSACGKVLFTKQLGGNEAKGLTKPEVNQAIKWSDLKSSCTKGDFCFPGAEDRISKLDTNVAVSACGEDLFTKRLGGKEGQELEKPEVNQAIKSSDLNSCCTKNEYILSGARDRIGKLDQNVVSACGKALFPKQLGGKDGKELTKPEVNQAIKSSDLNSSGTKDEFLLSGAEDRIVIYYTSLRGIRRTYEDCCDVRMIFRGFRVAVDEKDISMDSSYRKELKDALGGKAMSLPQVFIRGKHIGGAEEIMQLHEIGALSKLLVGIPAINVGLACQSCGDARFLPCPNCSGSRKIYEENEGQLRRCPDCNENGLIRCHSCCP